MIQITDDPSAERTAPPRSTHVRSARRLLLLDPARGKERLMEIQQHDGVVVEAAGISAGLRQAQREGEVLRGERGAPGDWVRSPPSPSLYRGPGGRRPPRDPISRGAAAKGETCPPSQVGRPPPPGFPTLGAGGGPWGGVPAHQGLVPFPLQPMGPSGIGGPTRWTPGTLPVLPVQYR